MHEAQMFRDLDEAADRLASEHAEHNGAWPSVAEALHQLAEEKAARTPVRYV